MSFGQGAGRLRAPGPRSLRSRVPATGLVVYCVRRITMSCATARNTSSSSAAEGAK
jgi:hypothetical protein